MINQPTTQSFLHEEIILNDSTSSMQCLITPDFDEKAYTCFNAIISSEYLLLGQLVFMNSLLPSEFISLAHFQLPDTFCSRKIMSSKYFNPLLWNTAQIYFILLEVLNDIMLEMWAFFNAHFHNYIILNRML